MSISSTNSVSLKKSFFNRFMKYGNDFLLLNPAKSIFLFCLHGIDEHFNNMQKYQPYASDPNLSGALASVLWELNLLTKHYHPALSALATSISTMNSANNQVCHSNVSPQQAFLALSREQESFIPPSEITRSNNKKKRGGTSSVSSAGSKLDTVSLVDRNEVKGKLCEQFSVLSDIVENKRLRNELDKTNLSLKLYDQYRKQRKKKTT